MKFFGVVLVGGTVNLLWTSSFGATDPNISPRLRGYTILQRGKRYLGQCQTCLTPIEIGRVDIILSKGRTRSAVRKSGQRSLMVLIILGVLSRIQVQHRLHFHFFLYLFIQVFNAVCFLFSSASVHPCISDQQEAFICRVLEIPFDEQKCRDLITLDTLHAYCGGLY